MAEENEIHDYHALDPDRILHAIENQGYRCDGRILALNSYENRVYQIGLEEQEPVIAKFYRPNRWTNEMILEEHAFTCTLAEHDMPVIAPLKNTENESLFIDEQYRFALYPRRGGYPPELDDPEHLLQLGQYLAQIHNLGESDAFQFRPALTIEQLGTDSYQYLLQYNFIPSELIPAYESLALDVLRQVQTCFDRAGTVQILRLHGDCHHGNILWRNDKPFFVDFDDARMGPAIQDLWMLLSGDRLYMTARLNDLMEGYIRFRQFNPAELHLIEALRTLRIMHYAAWLARRWDDPAFPIAFPFFNTQRYWEDHILALREQSALMDEAPLEWYLD